jgi:tetratricopeptide (TPR) repeat protein
MALPVLFLLAAITTIAAGAPAETSTETYQKDTYQYVLNSSDPAVHRAADLLNASRPMHALEQLQDALLRHPHDPKVLLLAGLAAYRSDQIQAALDYWKMSLDLAPNQTLNRIYEDAQREAAADQNSRKLYGVHIALRYDSEIVDADSARAILTTLDDAYSRISGQLGCSADERIAAIVRSRESYLSVTGAADWSGGQYDGRIHIAALPGMTEGNLDASMQRSLQHELVHACLMSIPSGSASWPAWLQEGLAQKLSGDSLQPSVREELRKRAASHRIPRLQDLGEDWSSMPKRKATDAYNLALAAADILCDEMPPSAIRNLLTDRDSLPRLTALIEAKLGF